MKKAKTFRKILSIALIMVMVLGTSVTGFAATTFSDINGHWAAASINYGVANGFIKGYADGTFKPDKPVTRAEFSRMLNVAFGIANTQVVNFYDVPSSEWYYQEVRKAVAAGYINGYEDNTFRPNSKITRQEAAVMIASVIPAAATTPSLAGLSDNGSIADWARAAVTKVYAKGYMRGDNNNMYNPLKSLTRAEAATILSSIISKENIVSDDTTLSTNGKSISDTIYANDLIVSKALGTGSVDLSDSMVLGTMSVLGGGTGSIGIYDTNIHNMSVAKTTGDVRVFLSGDSTVKDTVMENGAVLEHKALRGLGFQNIYFNGSDLGTQEVSLIGSFKQLYINTAATIKATSGSISNVNITRDAAGDVVKLGGTYNAVTFEAKCLFELLTGKITTLTVNSGASSSTVKLNSGTSIITAVVDGIKTAFTGTGTIARLEANVNDITYETAPSRVVTASGVSRPPVLSADITAPTPTFVPANSATNILANSKITITFDEPIYKSNGNAISTSSTSSTLTDIQAIVQLRETSSTGTSKAYAATISSDKKTITITPNAVLAINTNYYVIIVSGTIEDANGNENSKITSTFKTGTTDVAAPVPTFTPVNGATNVATNAAITITFNEAVIKYNGLTLYTGDFDSSVTKNIIEVKTTSASGSDVPYSGAVSSDKKTITITPTSALSPGATYYVAVRANALKDAAGNVISLTSITFTTIPLNSANATSVATVKGLISGATYTMTQIAATNEAAVKSAIESKIATLALDGVGTTVTKVSYIEAVAGNTGNPSGTNGVYRFTVALTKGSSTTLATDTTATLTMTIVATAYVTPNAANAASVAAVKVLIATATYSMAQSPSTDKPSVKVAVESKINSLALDGVVTTVIEGDYIPAVAGNPGNLAGTNGTYTFTVGLSKGTGSTLATDTTATLTMTIVATAYVAPNAANAASVAAAKVAITGVAYTMDQASATNQAAVKAAVQNKINTLALDVSITVTVIEGTYTPASEGVSGTPAGTNGTYTFTVELSKGSDLTLATDTTATLTMTVLATPLV